MESNSINNNNNNNINNRMNILDLSIQLSSSIMAKKKEPKEFVQIQSTSSSSSNETETIQHQCAICLEDIREKTRLLPCSHEFCQYCLFQWINVKLYCPVCRQEVYRIVFKNLNNYEVFIVSKPSRMVDDFKDFLFQTPIMFKVGLKCLYEYFMNHANLKQVTISNDKLSIISLGDCRRGLHGSCSDRILWIFFRNMTYQYNLSAYKDPNHCSYNARDVTVSFLSERPGLIVRIIEFAKFDLENLQKVLNFKLHDNIFDELKNLLSIYDLSSYEFRCHLRTLIQRYCQQTYDFSYKFYIELNNFARSIRANAIEYVQNTSYLLSHKQIKSTEIITLTETSSDSDIEIIGTNDNNNNNNDNDNNLNKKRKRIDNNDNNNNNNNEIDILPTPGPSGFKKYKINNNNNNNNKLKINVKNNNDIRFINDTNSNNNNNNNNCNNVINNKNINNNNNNDNNIQIIQKLNYSKNDIREMRRIIRYSYNSEYFYRKLLLEIKKKFYNLDTILNSRHFLHLHDHFKNILLSTKLYNSNKLSNITSKRTLTIDEINQRLKKNSTSSLSRSHSSSESSDISDCQIILEQYENANQTLINNQIVKHALSPSHSIASQLFMIPKINQIQFENHIYSESD